MAPAIPPDLSALSPDDEARLAELVTAVLADAAPGQALVNALMELDAAERPALAAALYEALCYRLDVRDYWLQYVMWKVYRALGPARDDAAFFHAATVVRMQPDWSGSGQAAEHMFRILRRRHRDRDALAVFRHQMRFLPGEPAAPPDVILPILRRFEPAAPELAAVAASPRREASRQHQVFEQEARPPWTCPVFGGELPASLVPLTQGMRRDAVTVAEFADAEVLIYRDSVVVLDRFGELHHGSSVAFFPTAIRAWFGRQEAGGQSFPLHEADEAVMISDEYPGSNVCHTLLDRLTRLAIYQQVEVDIGRALVIGPAAALPAEQEMLRRAGVTLYMGTDRVARLRVRRLWVSSNCRGWRHAAHYGAAWAVAYLHRTLGGQGSKGWRRLYLSRGDAARRQVTNEAEVVALLEAHGFEAIMPGRMPYEAQLAAFRQASHVIAPHGAALAHLIFCPPGARVLEIFHPFYGTAAYAMQAAAAGFDYAAMVARDWESDTPEWDDPTQVDVGGSRFLWRDMRVDLKTLSRYLATLD